MPDLAFMTDVKHSEACCEADQLIGKEMDDHQEGGWQTFLTGSEPDGGPVGGEEWRPGRAVGIAALSMPALSMKILKPQRLLGECRAGWRTRVGD